MLFTIRYPGGRQGECVSKKVKVHGTGCKALPPLQVQSSFAPDALRRSAGSRKDRSESGDGKWGSVHKGCDLAIRSEGLTFTSHIPRCLTGRLGRRFRRSIHRRRGPNFCWPNNQARSSVVSILFSRRISPSFLSILLKAQSTSFSVAYPRSLTI